jgi:peroxiredoxin
MMFAFDAARSGHYVRVVPRFLHLFCLLALGWGFPATTYAIDPLELVHFQRPVPAPAFVLPNREGVDQTLTTLRGKVVLLNFWATWCPPYVAEMPALEVLHLALRTEGFTVVAVSSDKEGATVVGPFAERFGLTFPLLMDSSAAVSAAYGALDLPASFLIDRNGDVIAAARGARDWAAPGVIEYLRELIRGDAKAP